MGEQPVGHVDVVALARVLDNYVFAVDAALCDADGPFGGTLGVEFLRKFLDNLADYVFLRLGIVHLKMNLRILGKILIVGI